MESEVTVLGMMSGSSLDGLDLAIARFNSSDQPPLIDHFSWELTKCATVPLTGKWKSVLIDLPNRNALDYVSTDVAFGKWMGQQVVEFLNQVDEAPDLIVSHGHTVFHAPEKGISTQIGCGAHLSAMTGIPVLNNLRVMDIALGGQGAPLAPLSDYWLFKGFDFYLNIGGIANLSFIDGTEIIGYDVVGANQILNALAQSQGKPYDSGGQMASLGNIIPDLLKKANTIPFVFQPPPKSLGNDEVASLWTRLFLNHPGSINDRLHTACKHIAQVIANEIRKWAKNGTSYRLLPTGGGVFNSFLMECLNEELYNEQIIIEISQPDSKIIEYKEALLMALMGFLKIKGIPNCLQQVTGAIKDNSGGVLHGSLAKWMQ